MSTKERNWGIVSILFFRVASLFAFTNQSLSFGCGAAQRTGLVRVPNALIKFAFFNQSFNQFFPAWNSDAGRLAKLVGSQGAITMEPLIGHDFHFKAESILQLKQEIVF